MKKKSKKLINFLVLVIACCSFVFTVSACGKKVNLEILEDEIKVTEAFTKEIEVACDTPDTIEWSSSDEKIVTVSDGVINAISTGSAVITAQIDDKSDSVKVEVLPFNNEVFDIVIENSNVEIKKGETKTISPKLTYNGQTLDGKFTYESYNKDIVTVSEDGIITGVAFGTGAIAVKGDFNGKTVSRLVNVNVESSVVISAQDTKIDLYVQEDATNGHYAEKQLQLTCTDKGVAVSSPNYEYDYGEQSDVIEIINGVIKAKNAGNTILTVKYMSKSGEFGSVKIAINVHAVDKLVTEQPLSLDISSDNDTFSFASYNNNWGEITETYLLTDNGKVSLSVNESNVKIGRKFGDLTLVVATRNYNYKFDLSVSYTLKVSQQNVADLLTITRENVVLTEDLDIGSYLVANELNAWNSHSDYVGVFDGGNFTIKGLKCGNYGLFKSFGGTVKNLTVHADVNSCGILGSYNNSDTVVENVTLKVDSVGGGSSFGALFTEINSQGESFELTLNKIVVGLPKSNETDDGFVAGYVGGGKIRYDDCYFISGNGKEIGTKDNGVDTSGEVKILENIDKAFDWIMTDSNGIEQSVKDAFDKTFVLKISNQNKEKLKSLSNEYALLTEDISFPASNGETDEYITSSKFTGVLNGGGHSIDTILIYKNGLFSEFGGTVKNLTLTAKMRGGNIGAICNKLCDDAYVSDVYIDIVQPVLGNAFQGGITYLIANGYTLNVENCFVKGEATSDTTRRGCIASNALDGNAVLKNCYYTGYSGVAIPNELGEISSQSQNYGAKADIVEVVSELKNGTITMGEYVQSVINQKYPIVLIYKNNLNDLTTDERPSDDSVAPIFYLMEDIDFSTVSGYSAKTFFYGTLDGRGHTISNIKPTAVANSHKGFFNVLWNGAKITNIAFTDVDLSSGERVGLFGDLSPNRTVTLKDVFITIKDTTLPKASGLISYGKGGTLIMADVFIYNKATTSTNAANTGLLIGRHLDSAVSMSLYDCNFIVEKSDIFNSNSDGLVGDALGSTTYLAPGAGSKDYKFYEGLNAFKTDSDKNVTAGTFVESCVEKYLA